MWIPTLWLSWILWLLLQNYYTTASFYASKYLSSSKTCDVKFESYNVIAKCLPLWRSTCAEQLDPCKTAETVYEGNIFRAPRRFLKVRRVGIAVPQSQELHQPNSLWCLLTESFCRELGGDFECSCCGKKMKGVLMTELWNMCDRDTI